MTYFWENVSKEKFFRFVGRWPRKLTQHYPTNYYGNPNIIDYIDESMQAAPAPGTTIGYVHECPEITFYRVRKDFYMEVK